MSTGAHRAAGRAAGRARRKPMDWRVEAGIWAVQMVVGLAAFGLLGFAWIEAGRTWAGLAMVLAGVLTVHAIVALHRVLLGQEEKARPSWGGPPVGGDEPEPVAVMPVGMGTREFMPRDWKG